MKHNYKISDIRKALDLLEQNHPERITISLSELERITQKLSKPFIYSIDEIIRLLLEYKTNNHIVSNQLFKEGDVCKIIKVKKLALHHWRAKGYIRFIQYNTKSIRYDLIALLEDLQNIRDKNISFDF
jgi:hypothetical protein